MGFRGFGFSDLGLGFRVLRTWGLLGLGFLVGLGFSDLVLGFRDSGFRVWGPGAYRG